MAAIGRHWTTHALRQFCNRYNPDDYEPNSLLTLIDRIEFKYGNAFTNPYWDKHIKLIVIAKLTRRNLSASSKVRLVYDRRRKVVVTVLPLKEDPDRLCRLKTLTVQI